MSAVTPNDVRLFVTGFVQERLAGQGQESPNELSDDCDLLVSGVIDSLGVLDLVTAIQQYCGREIDFEALDPEQMTVVGPLCKFVWEQLEKT
jgi:acyl carrier protein